MRRNKQDCFFAFVQQRKPLPQAGNQVGPTQGNQQRFVFGYLRTVDDDVVGDAADDVVEGHLIAVNGGPGTATGLGDGVVQTRFSLLGGKVFLSDVRADFAVVFLFFILDDVVFYAATQSKTQPQQQEVRYFFHAKTEKMFCKANEEKGRNSLKGLGFEGLI